MFRQWISIIVVLFSLPYLCSCVPNEIYSGDEEYIFETDSQYTFNDSVPSKGYIMTASENGYYYISYDGYLHYIEKQTMKDTIVCGKPDCLHDQRQTDIVSELEKCNAYIFCDLEYQIFYFKQKLYCFSVKFDESEGTWIKVLLQMDLDGTKRKVLWECNWPDYENSSQRETILHRGKLYFFTLKGAGYGDDSVSVLYAYDLDTEKLQELYRYDQGENRAVNGLQAIGNSLYWARYLDDDFNAMELVRYDISTGEIFTYPQGNSAFCCGDTIYFYFREYDVETKVGLTWLKKTDRTGETLVPLDYHKEEDWKMIRANEEYLFLSPQSRKDGTIQVYDSETLEQVADLPFPDDSALANRPTQSPLFAFTALEDILIWYDYPHTVTFYANIADIGTDDFQWYQVEKVN